MRIAFCALVFVACGTDFRPDGGPDAFMADASPDASVDASSDAIADASLGCEPACGECEECVDGVCHSVGGALAVERLNSGWYHVLAISRDGLLYTWGENDNGQLGTGSLDDQYAGTPREGVWIAADGGSRHSCGVRADGTLWCTGANVHGQLGTGDVDGRSVFTQVAADATRDLDNPWVDVACGGLHTCALKRDGSIWCFGSAVAGQLGLGPPEGDVLLPTRIEVGTLANWASVVAQARFTCGVAEDDASLWCWGDNSNGQLGLGDADRDDRHTPQLVMATTRWTVVAVSALHACGIDDMGSLSCWGGGGSGRLGVGDESDRGSPTRVGADWADVATGFEHTCAVTRAGGLSCWGDGRRGQLGLGDERSYATPQVVGGASDWAHVVSGYYHGCGLDTAGTVLCWGDDGRGQLGGGRDVGSRRAQPGRVCFMAP